VGIVVVFYKDLICSISFHCNGFGASRLYPIFVNTHPAAISKHNVKSRISRKPQVCVSRVSAKAFDIRVEQFIFVWSILRRRSKTKMLVVADDDDEDIFAC